jgi:hypothetical protein
MTAVASAEGQHPWPRGTTDALRVSCGAPFRHGFPGPILMAQISARSRKAICLIEELF